MSFEYQKLQHRAEVAEHEIKNLEDKLQYLRTELNKNVSDLELPAHTAVAGLPDELAQLITDNIKLKMRSAVLKRAIEEEEKSGKRKPEMREPVVGSSILNALEKYFAVAVQRAYPELPDAPVIISLSGNSKFGDYQCNSAMPITQLLKAKGEKANPREVAQKLMDSVPPFSWVEKLEIAGPGFINISLSRSVGHRALKDLLENGVHPPPVDRKITVLVDFPSPNIAKDMHVGHLRAAIIGESVSRLFEFVGHKVLRVNHLGDWGTQFGMLITHLQDIYPDYQTKSPPISDLQTFYKESKKRFDEDAEFKKRSYESVVKLQSFDPVYNKAWQLICDVSRKEFQKIYDRLDLTSTEIGESFYQSRMEQVVKELEEKGLLEEDEGRKVMFGRSDRIPFTIVKSDGGFTYDTSDMATIKYRIHEQKADWIIYVVDAGQSTHFEVLEACAVKAGILDPKKVRMDHVQFGVVLGEDKKKFKTRSGETVKLAALLDEGLKRAGDKLKEKGRDQVLTPEELRVAQEAVAYGCIKYADLSHNRTHEYIFSFDKMLEDKGNTAVYLLYMLTRIRSIGRLAGFTPEALKESAKNTPVSLDHEKEWNLAKVILRFPETLEKIMRDLLLHHLCEYLYDVSTAFSEFYDNCYCVEKNPKGEIISVNVGRLLLCEVTASVMEKCFQILGIRTVSKM
ncbi:arginine--tRNA ligase, cytoplasmic [Thrips palmi]|uniref:Probable arginine--tRNA ligase, cytoplasmic n=1 Tax=Thrips palmi TaxID=161013 RepID=A0A6P9A0N6_THRPL|nr:arginine--tRNA ligase, cytoplasmic [Thrips palmi]